MEEKRSTRILRLLSMVISIVMHPVFLPVYGLLLIFNAPTFMVHLPAGIKRVIFLLTAVNMTIVPVALLPLLKMRNVITSYSMELRKERIIPLALGTMMYVVTTVIFYSYQIPVIIKSFMLSASLTSFLILIITFNWKISVHAAGAGGLLATVMVLSIRMYADLIIFWLPLIVLTGILMSARLYLRSHNPAQVYTGFLIGFVSFSLVMFFF